MKKVVWASVFLLALATCRGDPETGPSVPSPGGMTLTIGLIPEQNIFEQLRRYEPLARYVSEKVGAQIDLKALPRYGNIVSNFQEGHLDGAFFGSFTYVLTHRKIGVEALARPEGLDGVSSYHGYLIVRRDSGIEDAGDMKGKVFAFVDKATTAGYLFPLAYFKQNGIDDYGTYFKETYFAGTHADVILDVLNKKADIGAVKNTMFHRVARENPRVDSELKILARCPDVPENGFAVRRDLPGGLKDGLKRTLLGMHEDPKGKSVLKEFGARRFIVTTDEDYAPVVSYAATAGLDLASYDYLNE